MRTLLVLAVAAAHTATPILANVPMACIQAPTFDAAVAKLTADGWAAQPRGAPFTPSQTDALAWTLMTRYIGTDTGGEDVATLLDLQRAAVPGLLARVDSDTFRSRVLLNGDDVLTITETRTMPGRVERSCRLASVGPAPKGLDVIDTEGIEGAPATLAETLTILPEE